MYYFQFKLQFYQSLSLVAADLIKFLMDEVPLCAAILPPPPTRLASPRPCPSSGPSNAYLDFIKLFSEGLIFPSWNSLNASSDLMPTFPRIFMGFSSSMSSSSRIGYGPIEALCVKSPYVSNNLDFSL